MSVEMNHAERSALHAALGEPMRLVIADALALGDASPSELARRFALSSNLLAHHLGILESAGAVERHRSDADRRRSYVRLTARAYPFVSPEVPGDVRRVVFICTHNSARSQLAAAMWAHRSKVPVASAGTEPSAQVNPRAVEVAERHGLDLRAAGTAHVRDVIKAADLVVAVCDRAYEQRVVREQPQLHWSVRDPAPVGTREAFDRTFTQLHDRVDRLVTVLTTAYRANNPS